MFCNCVQVQRGGILNLTTLIAMKFKILRDALLPFTSQVLTSTIIDFGQRLSKKVNMAAIAAISTDVHRFAEETLKLRCKNDNGREKAT